ncbi:hypothetical protein A9P82_05135 [Arachidicoccus ginsenosidimutans]|nr:hypothetical protein A9P82_05135 [Arachidicoccus sp. BS20]
MIKKYFIFLLIVCCCLQTKAQSFGEKTSIGFFGGVSKYEGSMPQTLTRGAAGINFRYEITDKLHIRFQFTATETGGGDSSLNNAANNGNDTRSQFYYFHTNINEFSLLPEYDFFNINAGAKFTPYIFAGIGYYNFKPYQIVENIRDNGTFRYQNVAMPKVENYSNWQMSIPLGIGIKYAISPNVILNAEGNYRFLTNPYIDNYSADKKNDKFYTFSLGISFRFSPIAAKESFGTGRRKRNCNCPPVY